MGAWAVSKAKIVYNKILGAYYVVVGPHHTPISGAFKTRAAAQAWLDYEKP
jgi:hypothetical protein